MTLSPKARFLKSPDAKLVADMVVNPAFIHAVEASLSELQLASGKADPAGNWQRLQGAKAFISILLNLPEPPAKPRRGVPHENLNPV